MVARAWRNMPVADLYWKFSTTSRTSNYRGTILDNYTLCEAIISDSEDK